MMNLNCAIHIHPKFYFNQASQDLLHSKEFWLISSTSDHYLNRSVLILSLKKTTTE